MHVFARGVGNFELPSNHDIVVQRGRKFVLFVDKTMHVFAREGSNF